jgi:hypothetical protein
MSGEIIDDPVFGTLRKRFTSWRREIDQSLYGTSQLVQLIVDCNNAEGEIFSEQRQAYLNFKAHESEIIGSVEAAIGEYIRELAQEYEVPVGDPSKHVRLAGIVFPMVLSPGECTIGFLLECDFDVENGIGIKISNGHIEIGYQDIVA